MGISIQLKITPRGKTAVEVQEAHFEFMQKGSCDDCGGGKDCSTCFDKDKSEDGCKDVGTLPGDIATWYRGGWMGGDIGQVLNESVGDPKIRKAPSHLKMLEKKAFELAQKAMPMMKGADLQHIMGYFEFCDLLHKERGIDTCGELGIHIPDWNASIERANKVREKFVAFMDTVDKKGICSRKVGLFRYKLTLDDARVTLGELDDFINMMKRVSKRKDVERYYISVC